MRMDASWSGPYGPTGYKVAARIPRAQQRAPLGGVIPTTTSLPTCSGLSRRGLEAMKREANAERRPAFDSPLRAPASQHVWVGAKKRVSRSNKETGMRKKWRMP